MYSQEKNKCNLTRTNTIKLSAGDFRLLGMLNCFLNALPDECLGGVFGVPRIPIKRAHGRTYDAFTWRGGS